MNGRLEKLEDRGTGDREWLYDAVLKFITQKGEWETVGPNGPRPKSDRSVWDHFAGMHSSRTGRPSWDGKRRVVKRPMLRSAIQRLIKDGRIKEVEVEDLNLKSMNGSERKLIEHRQRMFGKEFDGKTRSYVAINILDGIIQALESSA